MDVVFKGTTVIISQAYIDRFSYKTVQSKLAKLRKAIGVEFSNSNALHGSWEQISATFDILNHWDRLPEHEPPTANNLKLCQCAEINNVLQKLVKNKNSQDNVHSTSFKTNIQLLSDNVNTKKKICNAECDNGLITDCMIKDKPGLVSCKEAHCTQTDEDHEHSREPKEFDKNLQPLVNKGVKKPGEQGYWSRLKRDDNNVEHTCSVCSVVLKSRKRFHEHMRRMHLKQYKCELCHKGFGYPSDLAKHKCNGRVETKKVNIPGQKPAKQYSCDHCNFLSSTKAEVEVHIRKKHTSYSCEQCSEEFSEHKLLKLHVKTEHEAENFICDKCSKSYKSKKCFDAHLKTHEQDFVKPNFVCSVCDKSFTTKYVLSQHLKTSHLGIKNTFLCPICGKHFTQRNSLKYHMNVHNGITPYKCDRCEKAFTYHKSLQEHKYMHDNIRRFSCDTCGKKFRQRTTLFIHKKTHKEVKDHKCKECGKQFSQRQALERHKRIHNGVRPYKCLHCSKKFIESSSIRRHMIAIHDSSPAKWKEHVLYTRKKSDYYVNGESMPDDFDPSQYGDVNVASESQDMKNDSSTPNVINDSKSSHILSTSVEQSDIRQAFTVERATKVTTSTAAVGIGPVPSVSALNSPVVQIPYLLTTGSVGQMNAFQSPGDLHQIIDLSNLQLIPEKSNSWTNVKSQEPSYVQLQPSLHLLSNIQPQGTGVKGVNNMMSGAKLVPLSLFKSAEENREDTL